MKSRYEVPTQVMFICANHSYHLGVAFGEHILDMADGTDYYIDEVRDIAAEINVEPVYQTFDAWVSLCRDFIH